METIKNFLALLFAAFTLLVGGGVLYQTYYVVMIRFNGEEMILLLILAAVFIGCAVVMKRSQRTRVALESLFSW